jgi:hypothetical protein
VHSDDAPTVYLTGNPASSAQATRDFERATGQLTAHNPITGNTDTLTEFLADPVEMKLLHMITADPARTPTFTLFADPNYFLFAGAPNCNAPCVVENPAFAWNHGDVNADITTTWLGMVGPGIQHLGVTDGTWSDHTDIRPTMLTLLGLKDDYRHQGRALFEFLLPSALPAALKVKGNVLSRLVDVFKRINAPVNQLGLESLLLSTRALESGSVSDDGAYTNLEAQLSQITVERDAIASQMLALLEGSEFNGQAFNKDAASQLIDQATQLLSHVHDLAASAA